jgi:hypothetical protein
MCVEGKMILLGRRVVRVGCSLLLTWITLGEVGLATVPQVPTKDVGYECDVSATPEMGKEFTVTITLWLNEPTYYGGGQDAGAELQLDVSGPQLFISGDTILVGKFSESVRCTLRATYKAVTPGSLSIGAILCTRDEVDSIGRPYIGGYTNTPIRCALYQLVAETLSSSPQDQNLPAGVVIRTLTMDELKVPLPLLPLSAMATDSPDAARKNQPRHEVIERSLQLPDTTTRVCDTSIVVINLKRTQDGCYTAPDTLRVSVVNPSRVLLIDSDTRKAIPGYRLSVDTVLGSVRSLDDTTFLFEPSGRVGNTLIEGSMGPSNISINCEIAAVWMLDGAFYFTDPSGYNDNRMESLTLYIYDKNSSGQWTYAYSWSTDENGYFSIFTSEPDIAVQVVTEGSYCFVFYTDGYFQPGSGESSNIYQLAVTVHNANLTDLTIPASYTTVGWDRRSLCGAFNICNVIRNGYVQFGHYMPDAVPVYYDDADASIESSYNGGFTIDGVVGMVIKGEAHPTLNRDQWDQSVILHEFGHSFMVQNAEIPPLEDTISHYYFEPTVKSTLEVAYIEGWANFYACVATGSPVFVDKRSNGMILLTMNLEQPYPDVPYSWLQMPGPSEPPSDTALNEGASVEGAFSEMLWDIFDTPNDANYYIGSTLWGHNDDQNSSASWRGLGPIVDVLTDYDPQPGNGNHDYCWNVYEFIHGWKDKGYPLDQTFMDLSEAHNVPVFVPGNVNDGIDQVVSIGDVTSLIAYLFRGVGPLAHPSAADVNASCSLSIADASMMIDALYISGDQSILLAGCIDLYP